jgi:hypothetical protein
MGATAQGILSGVSMGLGGAAGALIGGILYANVGLVLTFRFAGLSILGILLLLAVVGKYVMKLDVVPATS